MISSYFFATHPELGARVKRDGGKKHKKNCYSTTLSVSSSIHVPPPWARNQHHRHSDSSPQQQDLRPNSVSMSKKGQRKVQTQRAKWVNTEAWSSQKVKEGGEACKDSFREKSLQLDRGQCEFQTSINIYPRSHLAGGIWRLLRLVPQTECTLMPSCERCKL